MKNKHEVLKENLLQCLHHLATLRGKGISKDSLTIGLPMKDGKMTPVLFLRALKRIHLQGQIFNKPLSELTPQHAPCILLLKEDYGIYVEQITEEGFWASSEGQIEPQLIPQEDLTADYNGHIILFKSDSEKTSHVKENFYHQHWLWGTLYQIRSVYYKVIMASFLTNIFSLFVPLYSMNIYDRVIPNSSFSTMWVLSFGIIFILVFDLLLKVIKSHYVDTASKHADIVLSSKLLERILGMQFSDRTLSVGALTNHVREMEVLREFFSSVTLLSLIDFPFAVLFLMMITLVGGIWFLVAAIIGIIITLISSWIVQVIVSQYVAHGFASTNLKSSFMVETIIGLETIKASGAESKKQYDWEQINEQHAKYSQYASFFSSLALNLSSTINNFNYVIFIMVGVFLVSSQELTMGGLIACTILGSRAIQPFSVAASLILKLNQVLVSYKTINAIMSLEMERTTDKHYFTKPNIVGGITFKNVSFSYPGQKVAALKDVSFSAQPKDRVAILGKIGSGKTTLEKLILGFYKPSSGHVLIDGVDLQQLDPADVRKHIGYVSQDIYLFSGSVLDNVIFGAKSHTPKQVEQALIISGAIHFVLSNPDGLNMQVGEGGRFLSGGQKQTIGIARAILRDPPILIFDEPTTMMDQQTENWFLSHFKTYLQDKTCLIISHNPQIVSLATKVILIDEGKTKFFGDVQDFMKALKPTVSAQSGMAEKKNV